MRRIVPNEMVPWAMGISSINAFARCDSGSRLSMFASQMGQPLVLKNGDIDRLSTGVMREFAGDIHDIRFPNNAIVESIIQKYPSVLGSRRKVENTQTAIIYENVDSPIKEFSVIFMERYHSLHQHFGFDYVLTKNAVPSKLYVGAPIGKDTVLATSPAITEHGDYKLGVELQAALATFDSVIEDGVIVSDLACERMATKGYGVRTASWGEKYIPLNRYGNPNDPTDYKPHPDIGEFVNPDGILFASRRIDDRISVSMMSRKALREVDFFDRAIYVTAPNAKVIDIIVYKGNKERSHMPLGMDNQCMFYYNKTVSYYKSILEMYHKLTKKHGKNLQLSPELLNLVKTAMAYVELPQRRHVTPTMNLQDLDEWRVDIVFEYDIIPTIGNKVTGCDGDKGVICEIRPWQHMPVDATGNRAEIIMDPDSTFKRMNPGRIWRQYINAACRMIGIRLKEKLNSMVVNPNVQEVDALFEYLMGFYNICSPMMYDKVREKITTTERKLRHLNIVAANGAYLYLPTHNPVLYYEVVADLMEHYPAPYGPVTFVGYNGETITTETPMLIGGLYMILLEKTGNLWSSVSSPKMQHFATPGKMSNADKYTSPGRVSSTRAMGEAENRLYVALCGGKVCADIMDQSTNPSVHRHVCEGILRAPKPTNIPVLVDRTRFPRGNGRIHSLIRNNAECAGILFKRDIIHDEV